jgi:hypothetical protein
MGDRTRREMTVRTGLYVRPTEPGLIGRLRPKVFSLLYSHIQEADFVPTGNGISSALLVRCMRTTINTTKWAMTVRTVVAITCTGCFVVTACARRPVATVEPSTRVSDVLKASQDSTTVAGTLSTQLFRPGVVRYIYRGLSTVQSISGDSIPRTDSIRISALLTTAFLEPVTRQTMRAVSRVDSLQVATLPNAFVPLVPPVQARAEPDDTLEIERTTGRIRLMRPRTACSQATREPLLRGDEVIPVVPQRASMLRSWVDTTIRQLCRGGVTLRVTHAARYRLAEDNQSGPDLDQRIVREVESQIAGVGTQWEQPVEATGRATTLDTLSITNTTGRLHTVHSHSRTEIEFRSSQRAQKFVQTTTVQIMIQP